MERRVPAWVPLGPLYLSIHGPHTDHVNPRATRTYTPRGYLRYSGGMTRHDGLEQATQWYVVTGGPSSGKTTAVNLLRERGFATTIEHARHYIDLQRLHGRDASEVRTRQRDFQSGVVAMQIAQERALDPEQTVFLDRALPDSLAYYRFLGLEPEPALIEAIGYARYAGVFVMDLLPLASDYARTEDVAAQRRIHDLIGQVYRELPFPMVNVPTLAPEERVDFILERALSGGRTARGI